MKDGIRKVARLGTRYTMQQDFYKSKLEERGITVLIPEPDDIGIVNSVIYDELCLGILSDHSRKEFLRIMDQLAARGAEGVILGCTEIGLLVRQEDTKIPLFDTTRIHATQAALSSIGYG